MNPSIEGADVPERKKPGRKPKVITPEHTDQVLSELSQEDREKKMADMVLRQWTGQSPDLPVGERISRIRIAMKKHGYMDLWENVTDILKLNEKDARHV